jgi:hypothetical protein
MTTLFWRKDTIKDCLLKKEDDRREYAIAVINANSVPVMK